MLPVAHLLGGSQQQVTIHDALVRHRFKEIDDRGLFAGFRQFEQDSHAATRPP